MAHLTFDDFEAAWKEDNNSERGIGGCRESTKNKKPTDPPIHTHTQCGGGEDKTREEMGGEGAKPLFYQYALFPLTDGVV